VNSGCQAPEPEPRPPLLHPWPCPW
jgi:hypothetical protein